MAINPDHFIHHAQTPETSPRYAAIREAEEGCHALIAFFSSRPVVQQDFMQVNSTLLTFAQVIDANAPDSADKTAAVRCVRLARNALNEHVASCLLGFPVHMNMLAEATRQIVLARWQANSAIACGGK